MKELKYSIIDTIDQLQGMVCPYLACTHSTRTNPVAAVPTTLGCWLSADRKVACFYVDGKEVHRVDSATTLVAAVDLVPCVIAYEQGTAFDLDIDYIYAKKARASA